MPVMQPPTQLFVVASGKCGLADWGLDVVYCVWMQPSIPLHVLRIYVLACLITAHAKMRLDCLGR